MKSNMASPFTEEMQTIRQRLHDLFMNSAPTDGFEPAAEQVAMVLNEVLGIELLCLLRYERHYYLARRLNADSVKQEFLEQAKSEWAHADQVAERIDQLGGEPDFDPETLCGRNHVEGSEEISLRSILREELAAERITSATYADIARWLGDKDPASRRLIERLLEKEEERIEDLISLLLGRLAGDDSGNALAGEITRGATPH
jgi:bacterioferritin